MSAASPGHEIRVWDCNGNEILPGTLIDISASRDDVALRVTDTSAKLLSFWKAVFGRDSIDNRGCSVDSSIHFSRGYCNASWSDGRMIYGDGDGYLFTDFTCSTDFIGHEIMHGITECESALGYQDEYGALNESLSDVFGSIFRQWIANETADSATWLIGADLLTPKANSMGWKCIRDLAAPQASHSISPQASNYSQYIPGGDPHYNSGIPNLAFYLAATAVSGYTWEKVGLVWYRTLCSPVVGRKCTFATFANETLGNARQLFPNAKNLPGILKQAWVQVGITAH